MNADKLPEITQQQIQLALDFESIGVNPNGRGHALCEKSDSTDPQDVSWLQELGYTQCLRLSLNDISAADPATRLVSAEPLKIKKYPVGVDDQCLCN